MFGWLKSLFGSAPVQETVVPPPLPKVKKAAKKTAKKTVTKPAVKAVTKKTVTRKKKVEVVPVIDTALVVEPVAESAPKKKSGRPKKA